MSTSVNPVAVLAPWQRAATAPEYAKEVGVTMEVEHVDYKRIALWDLETAQSIQKNKILRNVVTAARRCSAHTVVQASEDLQLRLWDSRSSLGKGPVMAVRAGPNQLICLDVPQADAENSGASWVACGSKGFSRENCEVKVFDLRGSLRQQAALACADQTIEALQCLGRDQCLIASKDVHLRAIALPQPEVLWERRGSHAGYTALGLASSRCLAASVSADRVALELLAVGEEAKLLASSG